MVAMRKVTVALLALFVLLHSSALAVEVAGKGAKVSAPTFSTSPSEGEHVAGDVTILVGTTTGLDSAQLDLFENGNWGELSNITSASSWIYNWDSTTVLDGQYQMRLTGWANNSSTGSTLSANFTVDNTAPSNLAFVVESPDYGSGNSISDRAWFNIPSNGTLSFTWNATDTNLDYATLTDVPGPGAPSNDGPGFLVYRWDWTSGSFPAQGTWSPDLTVYDEAGNSATLTRYVGIDTVGPTVGTPSLSVGSDWSSATTLVFSNLNNGATDSSGSGIAGYEVRDSADATWQSVGVGGSGNLPLNEGIRVIQFRAVDNVVNSGNASNYTLKIDQTAPVAGGWSVPELTTATTGAVPVTASATDALSGINFTQTKIQYGFDSDGVGDTPDITSSWIDVGSGLTTSLSSSIDWSTKQGQFLSLRAVMVDNASNSANSPTQHFMVFPSLDLSWESASVDRLVVRAGSEGVVNVTAKLVSSETYSGAVVVRLQSAPADRDNSDTWTTLESRTISPGGMGDMQETLTWSVTILNEGEYDLRLTVDPADVISERDEANNDAYMVAQGAGQKMVGAVTGFAPTLLLTGLAGMIVGMLLPRRGERETES